MGAGNTSVPVLAMQLFCTQWWSFCVASSRSISSRCRVLIRAAQPCRSRYPSDWATHNAAPGSPWTCTTWGWGQHLPALLILCISNLYEDNWFLYFNHILHPCISITFYTPRGWNCFLLYSTEANRGWPDTQQALHWYLLETWFSTVAMFKVTWWYTAGTPLGLVGSLTLHCCRV